MSLGSHPALRRWGMLATAGALTLSACATRHAEAPRDAAVHQGLPQEPAPERDSAAKEEHIVVVGKAPGAPVQAADEASPVAGAPAPVAQKKEAKVHAAPGGAAPSARMSSPPPAALPPPPPAGGIRSRVSVGREAAVEPPSPGNTYARVEAHSVTRTAEDPLSTFAVDVDTASYTVARRHLQQDALPPPESVRVEEFVNYFKYAYPQPESGAFAVHLEGAPSPFGKGKTLLKVGLQGRTLSRSQRKPAHLVFLVDVSGSMAQPDKLPLAQEALKLLVRGLNENDTVALVTYAGAVRDVLPPTPATEWQRIDAAIDALSAGGGTAMGSGLQLAYAHALKKAGGGATSRVIVLTDGDANLGPNLTADAMLESVRKAVAEGVTLSTIGFGMGNYRDDLMERLADKGNGNCFYIDSMREARKVFQTQLTGTLEVIAKDVKVQVEFNPATVATYRLLGYENRDIADRDFRNDKVDAGEIGAGHSVTALYEVELTGAPGELATVRVRAKEPSGTQAREQAFHFGRDRLAQSLEKASDDLRFATAVAGSADILRQSPASETWNLATALKLAEGATRALPERVEFVQLLTRARELSIRNRGMAAGKR